MRINRYIAGALGIGRRQADNFIAKGRVKVDGLLVSIAQDVQNNQIVTLDGKQLELPIASTTIILNKPVGYVVSRKGQGAKTIYSLLPNKYYLLKAVGRLDKDSSGLLIMTNDGLISQRLAHPSFNKQKTYEVTLDRHISKAQQDLLESGIELEDGPSIVSLKQKSGNYLIIAISDGRNRQIRRTFQAIGCKVTKLNRIKFAKYDLGNLEPGQYREITP